MPDLEYVLAAFLFSLGGPGPAGDAFRRTNGITHVGEGLGVRGGRHIFVLASGDPSAVRAALPATYGGYEVRVYPELTGRVLAASTGADAPPGSPLGSQVPGLVVGFAIGMIGTIAAVVMMSAGKR